MRRILFRIFAAILIICSLLMMLYPFISNYLMSLNQESQVSSYSKAVDKIKKQEKSTEYQDAWNYNQKFLSSIILTDPFDPNYDMPEDVQYENTLNMGDGLMGTVEIPAIDVNLPIYHGTSQEVLQKGVGHMQNTSLPIGGESTHCVLTGHTGLPIAKLFTDLDLLKLGDMFYVRVLGDIRAYKVVKIYVIEPNDTNSLRVKIGEDLVSLITCTPYGINTHRLIIRGKRVPYVEETYENQRPQYTEGDSAWMAEYKQALIVGISIFAVIVIVYIVIRIILKKRRKRRGLAKTKPLEIDKDVG